MFKKYRKKSIAEMRPYIGGEIMTGISVSEEDKEEVASELGGMIARNPANHSDQWYVGRKFFQDNYEQVDG